MSILGTFTKQPAEVLDYTVDFTDWFSSRTDLPSSAAVVAEAGITIASFSLSGKAVDVVLSGGTDGAAYKVTVRLTTTATPPRVKEADFLVKVKES